MEQQYLVFKSFHHPEVALEMADLLKENGIACQLQNTAPPIDPMFGGTPIDADYRVMLKPSDFERAHALLADQQHPGAETEEDYYLYSFSNEELMDLLRSPSEWGAFDYALAQKILRDRGITVHADTLSDFRAQDIREAAAPKPVARKWIIAGYLCAVFFPPVGIILGSVISGARTTLPNGYRSFTYTEKARDHGKNMFTVGLVLAVAAFILNVVLRRGA